MDRKAYLTSFRQDGPTILRITRTWEEVHDNLEEIKREFRECNDTDAIIAEGGRDIWYDQYCEALDRFLLSVPLDQIDKQYRIEEAKRRRALL